MAWKIDGKIAGHFPNSNPSNRDAYRIVFAPPGETSVSNFEEIEKVYFVPAGVQITQSNLQNYLVWRRYWEEPPAQRTLVAGNQDVCIEFVPSQDIQLTQYTPIAIFTDSTTSDEDANFAIIHESGLVVAKTRGDTIDPNVSELYGLSGEKRFLSVTGVTLKAGYKYYIQYTNKTNQKTSTFKPAYFQNEVGNYLVWVHDTVQDKSVANINSLNNYLGVVTNAAVWLAASEDDFMISMIGQGGLNNTYAYVRNDVANGAEVIGQDMQTLPAAEKDKFLDLANGDSFMYIGNNYTESGVDVFQSQKIYTKNNTLDSTKYKGIKTTAKGILDDLDLHDYCLYNGSSVSQIVTQNHVYEKIASLDISSDIDLTVYSTNTEMLFNIIRLSSSVSPYGNVAIKAGYMYYSDRTGYVYKLKSNYTVDLGPNNEGYSGSSAPHVTNCIYYLNDATATWQAGMWMWNGSGWTIVGCNDSAGTLENFFDITTFADAVQEVNLTGSVDLVGQLSDLVKSTFNGNYISNSVREQTVQTDKKFYLSIDGQEV